MSDETSSGGKGKEGNLLRRLTKSISKLVHNPAKHFGVKDVLAKDTVIFQGWLRKKNTSHMMAKALDSMNIKWGIFYVLVTEKSIYYFKSETSSSFVGKFSLFGYNNIKRVKVEENCKWPEHSIMIKHASDDPQYKTYYFACAHYEEWKNWMRKIRKALISANQSLVAGGSRPRSDSSTPVEELEESIYPSEHFVAQNLGYAKDDPEIESDDSDYEMIDDEEVDKPPPVRRPMTGAKPPPALPHDSYQKSYIEFDQEMRDAVRKPKKPLPKPPLPALPTSPTSPSYGGAYQDQEFPGPASATTHGLPKFLDVSSTPANDVLKQLQDRAETIHTRKAAAAATSNNHLDSMPSNEAPGRPFAYTKGLPNPPTGPMKPKFKPPPSTVKPPILQKPTLPVKPRMMPEKLYWNGSKEDGARLLRESLQGVFIIRASERPGTMATMVIAAKDGEPPHSVRVNIYSDQTMGLKGESIVTDVERFPSIAALVKYYQRNFIHLRNGAVEVTLRSAHPQCEPSLD